MDFLEIRKEIREKCEKKVDERELDKMAYAILHQYDDEYPSY